MCILPWNNLLLQEGSMMLGHFSAHPWCRSKMILFVFFCLFWGTKRGGNEGPTLLLLLGPSCWSWIIFLMQFCIGVSIAAICVVYIAASCTVCPWWSRASLNNRKDAKVFLCICSHLFAQKPLTHYSFVSWRSLVLITCRPSTILILKPFFYLLEHNYSSNQQGVPCRI